MFYPGLVLLEATNISEGRGTTTPFELAGAPFIDPERLWRRLQSSSMDVGRGCVLRPYRFEPTFQKHAGESCGGVFFHPTDPVILRSYRAAISLLGAVKELWPDEFNWRQPPYEYETEKMPIDILTGDSRLRHTIDAGLKVATFEELVSIDHTDWTTRTEPFRLYN